MIEGISPESLSHVNPAGLPPKAGATDAIREGDTSFHDLLSELLTEVNQAQKDADVSIRQLATGDSGTTIQDVVLRLEEADLTFRLMKEIRDKLVSAYKEVMSIQI